MEKIDMLPEDVVKSIVEFINQKRADSDLKAQFPNKLLREDVLKMLDRYCTVIYYPIKGEENHGFHITGIPDKDGEEQHFVFINTEQFTEIQVFTAAHELGHVWEVDKYICQKHDLELTTELGEKVINRFAAELLMPSEEFENALFDEFDKNMKKDAGETTIINLLKMIAALMDRFYVPLKSVVFRMVEVGALDGKTADIMTGDDMLLSKHIAAALPKIIQEEGYGDKLHTTMRKKWIEGLAGLLDRAESDKTVAQSKIDNMRQLFGLERHCLDATLEQTVTLKT